MKKMFYKLLSCAVIFSSISTAGLVSSFAATQTEAPDPDNVTITNNTKSRDAVYIAGLEGGATVKIYKSLTSAKAMASGKVSAYSDDVTVSVAQLGIEAGSIYITVTNYEEEESARVEVSFEAEGISDDPYPENISIENNAGISDTIYVTGLSTGDVVKIYNSEKGGKTLGTATMSSSKTEATVKVGQLGANGGTIYVAVTSPGMRESSRIAVTFTGEPRSDDPFTDYFDYQQFWDCRYSLCHKPCRR